MANSLNRDEIFQRLPHRPPFLWLDEVLSMDERQVRARKFLDPQMDVFRGHYPHFPVLPGVLQCEAAFQAGAILISQHQQTGSNQVPVVTRVNNVQFRRMVRPGDALIVDVELTDRLANAFYMKGKVSVEDRTAARLEFTCAATKLT